MTTNAAFKQLTSQTNWNELCGINPATARSLKRHFKEGKISQDKVFELLKSAGYKHSKIVWEIKPSYKV